MSIPEFHEVRVRARGVRLNPDSNATSQVSTRSDFIAPDLSPVSTQAIELFEKGLSGWTDSDKRVESVTPVFPDHAKRDLAAITLGKTIIRRTSAAPLHVMNRQGPATRKRSKFAN